MLLDIVFSLDSVITAIGMARQLAVMVAAVVIAVGVMMWASKPIGDFVERHPTVKMLALSFLLLIGVSLVAEGLRPAHPEGLHLLRDGLLGVRGGDQPAGARQEQSPSISAVRPRESFSGKTVGGLQKCKSHGCGDLSPGLAAPPHVLAGASAARLGRAYTLMPKRMTSRSTSRRRNESEGRTNSRSCIREGS